MVDTVGAPISKIQVSLSCFRRAGSKIVFFFWFLCGSCLLWVFLLCCVPCFPSLSLSLFLSLSSLFRPFSFFFVSFFPFPVSSSSLLRFFFLLFFFLFWPLSFSSSLCFVSFPCRFLLLVLSAGWFCVCAGSSSLLHVIFL